MPGDFYPNCSSPNSPHTRPHFNNTARMEVVGWSPSEELQDPDMFHIPPQVEGWTGAQDGESRYALANSPIQLPLTHHRLPPPASTPALRRIHSQDPPPPASSLLPSTSAVSKTRITSVVLETRSSSTAATSSTNTSPTVARSVPPTRRRRLCPRGPELRGRTRCPRPYGTTRS